MFKFTKSTLNWKVFLKIYFYTVPVFQGIFAFFHILTLFNYLYWYLLTSQLVSKDLFDNNISLTVVNVV